MAKKNINTGKVDKFIYAFSASVVALYIILKIVNRLSYPGFVFNILHIQPDSLKWPALVSLIPGIIIFYLHGSFRKLPKIQLAIGLAVVAVVFSNINAIYKSSWVTYRFILLHPFGSYTDRMKYTVGPLFYSYSMFIDKYTPKNATILIPPQAFPWPRSGNVGLIRYFLYPRKLSNGKELTGPTKEALNSIDYILLNWGDLDQVESTFTHGWPKFDVKAEKIIFMNEDGSFGGEVKGDYRYKDYKDKKVWGIIVVKH